MEEVRDPQAQFMYLVGLASCFRAEGNESEAAGVLERALVIRPDNVGLNNDIAYGWIDRGVQLDRAESMIRLAVSRQPRQMAYLDTFGWLLYKKQDFAAARKWIDRASRAGQREDPVVHDHLGDTYWRLGKSEEAIEHWAEALKLAQARSSAQRNADERRVLSTAESKINAVRSGRWPAVAPVAIPEDPSAAAEPQRAQDKE
jgi:Tfp pilus assembly protein PilF